MENIPIQYYGVLDKLIKVGKWPFRVEKVVTERQCFETIRYGSICKEEGYVKVMYGDEEVPVILSCKCIDKMDTTGFGVHEHYSSYLCQLETESVYGVRTSRGYIGPELAEFIVEIIGTDYMYRFRLNRILWIFDAEKGRIVLPGEK